MSGLRPVVNRAATLLGEPRQRRRGYLIIAVILALLCVFPRPYVARAKVVPQDASSIGLSSMMNALGGQLQGFAALLAPNIHVLFVGSFLLFLRQLGD